MSEQRRLAMRRIGSRQDVVLVAAAKRDGMFSISEIGSDVAYLTSKGGLATTKYEVKP